MQIYPVITEANGSDAEMVISYEIRSAANDAVLASREVRYPGGNVSNLLAIIRGDMSEWASGAHGGRLNALRAFIASYTTEDWKRMGGL